MSFIHTAHNDVIFKYTVDEWIKYGYTIQINNKFFPKI